jgi:hypothetical protein
LCIRRQGDSWGKEAKQRFEQEKEGREEEEEQEEVQEEEEEEDEEEEDEEEEEEGVTARMRIMRMLMLMGTLRRRRTAAHSDLYDLDSDTRERVVPVSFPFASKVLTLLPLLYYSLVG